jgi:hypothetical protein
MSRRHQRQLARTELVLTPVIHADLEASGDMVCQMRSLTAFGIYDWFYPCRPFPSGLQGSAAKCNSAQRALAVALGNCAEQAAKFGILDIERVLPVWKSLDQPILSSRE